MDLLRARILYYYARSRAGTKLKLTWKVASSLLLIGQVDGITDQALDLDTIQSILSHLPDEIEHDTTRGGFWVLYNPPQPTKRDLNKAERRKQAVEVWLYWHKATARDGRSLRGKEAGLKKITARLREGFTPDQLKLAIDTNWASQWWRAKGLNTITDIFRNSERVERFLSMAKARNQASNQPTPMDEEINSRLDSIRQAQFRRRGRGKKKRNEEPRNE